MSTDSRLAQLRHERGMTQARLAELSGISRAEVSAIETGRLVPSVAVALRIAAAMGLRVETVFGAAEEVPVVDWAWPAADSRDGRVWQALVGGRRLAYPVEPTAAGVLPHDAWFDGRRLQVRDDAAPEPTLVIAGCDPLVGLLAREMAVTHRIRVVPLLRSSAQALELLRQGVVHVAGLHVTGADGLPGNDARVRSQLGPGHRLLHQVQWDCGVALAADRRERSIAALVRARVRWVNREPGAAARDTLDALLGPRRSRPPGYHHVVRDHRAVATTVSSGWADAGVCVRPVAAEARLSFLPLHREAYELCLPDHLMGDPRVDGLLSVMRSAAYRTRLGDVPGCDSRLTGDVRRVA